MKYIILMISTLFPMALLADPLDQGEAYTMRSGPPQWMDNVDLGLLLVDYGIFALTLVALGWLLFKKPHLLYRLESVVRAPFAAIFTAAKRCGGVSEFILQMAGGLAVFVALAAWVFFCQWLKNIGLGALAMASASEEMSANVAHVAERTDQANVSIIDANQQSHEAGEAVSHAVDAMDNISQQVQQAGERVQALTEASREINGIWAMSMITWVK